MSRYIIIEDERFACDELKRMMAKLRPGCLLVGWAQSVEQAVRLVERGGYDFIITDIRLADGLCFEVFEQNATDAPVIFTTAYDEYALKAFKMNSIDYLLKPVDECELSAALGKLERNMLVCANMPRYEQMAHEYLSHVRKNRFMLRMGDTYRYILTADIAFVYSEDKTTFVCTFEDRRSVIDFSLDQIEPMLDPEMFFRLSRCCIANIKTINRVSRYFGGRLYVKFSHECPVKTLVSRTRASAFLKWLGGDVTV